MIEGSVSIYKGRADRYRAIYSGSSWFDGVEYFVFEDDGYCLVIKKCYMEIPKKAMKFTKHRNFQFVSEIPLGTYEFDEESNEDELIIYYV